LQWTCTTCSLPVSRRTRVKTRHRGHDVKYSSKQEPKRAIKQRHTSQSQAPLEYYSSVVGRDGVFTRPRSFAATRDHSGVAPTHSQSCIIA
jgi:hypothetical protein